MLPENIFRSKEVQLIYLCCHNWVYMLQFILLPVLLHYIMKSIYVLQSLIYSQPSELVISCVKFGLRWLLLV